MIKVNSQVKLDVLSVNNKTITLNVTTGFGKPNSKTETMILSKGKNGWGFVMVDFNFEVSDGITIS